MRKPFDCDHPEEQTTLRRRNIGPARLANFMFGHQCGNCGRLVGTWIKKERVVDPNALPEWDYGAEELWRKAEGNYRIEYHEQRVKEEGVAAFSKSPDRDESFWKSYTEYLRSEAWQAKRQLVLARAQGVCEGCGLANATQAHHLTYDRVGREMLFDLAAVCEECHNVIHGKPS